MKLAIWQWFKEKKMDRQSGRDKWIMKNKLIFVMFRTIQRIVT